MSTVHDLETSTPPAGEHPGAKFPAAPYEERRVVLRRLRGGARPGGELRRPGPSLDRAAAILLEAYTRGAAVFSCGNGGSASIANHLQCDHVKGVRTGDRPGSRGREPQRRTSSCSPRSPTTMATKTSSRTSCSRSQGPATCSSPSRRRVVRPTSCAPCTWARDNGLRDDRAHRLRRRRRQDGRRRLRSCRRHELRHHRGPAPGDHARPGPVHPAVADDRGRDLVECVLRSWQQPGPRADRAGPPGCETNRRRMRVAINLLTEDPDEPVGRPLVLDPGDPRDGQAARIRRGTAPAGQPEVAAPAPGLRAGRLLHHLPVVERAAQRCARSASTSTRRCGCRSAASTSSTP